MTRRPRSLPQRWLSGPKCSVKRGRAVGAGGHSFWGAAFTCAACGVGFLMEGKKPERGTRRVFAGAQADARGASFGGRLA
eukprot:6902096-Alexandrium_andersonii.AAC.1